MDLRNRVNSRVNLSVSFSAWVHLAVPTLSHTNQSRGSIPEIDWTGLHRILDRTTGKVSMMVSTILPVTGFDPQQTLKTLLTLTLNPNPNPNPNPDRYPNPDLELVQCH